MDQPHHQTMNQPPVNIHQKLNNLNHNQMGGGHLKIKSIGLKIRPSGAVATQNVFGI